MKSGSSTPLRIHQKTFDKNNQDEKIKQNVMVSEDYKKAMSKMYDAITSYVSTKDKARRFS
jgi:hypothetical protein